MTIRRTVFQPDLEVDLPEDEEALLERDGLLLPIVEDAVPDKQPAGKAGATVTAVPKETPVDGK